MPATRGQGAGAAGHVSDANTPSFAMYLYSTATANVTDRGGECFVDANRQYTFFYPAL